MDVLEGNMTVEELAQKKKEEPQSTGAVAIYEGPVDSSPA